MAACEYRLTLALNSDRVIDIRETVETNYKIGEARQMAHLFYRAMLASGHTPAATCAALAGIAQAGGIMSGGEVDGDQHELFFNDGRGGGE